MNILFQGSGRKKDKPDGNLILNQGMKATRMICVQVCQDNSIRGQTPGAQEAAENTVILPGVHDINFIVVPKHSRVSVSGAELYIFRYVMGNRKQGDNQRSRTEGQQCSAYPAVQSDKPAEAEKEKHKSGSCQDIRSMNPYCKPRKGAETAYSGKKQAGDGGYRTGKQAGKKRYREEKKRQPEKGNQYSRDQHSRQVDQEDQEWKPLERSKLRKQHTKLYAKGQDQRFQDITQETASKGPAAGGDR